VNFSRFILSRVLTFFLVIFIGITAVFFLPRLLPSDPVETMLARMTSVGVALLPEELDVLRVNMRRQFGLEGTFLEQYVTTLKRMLTFDFGPSIAMFPTPVIQLIGNALPYTVVLLLLTTLISWVFGNFIGLLAGFRKDKWYSSLLEGIAICIYPIPYFILALVMIILFCYINRWFPLVASFPTQYSFTLSYFQAVIRNSFLPAISLVMVGGGWWIISMKSLSSTIAEEDFIYYARLKGLSEGTIAMRYVFRNSILTQITALALNIGTLFNGALMMEIMFGYPGMGTLVQGAILQSDYNLMLGTISVSIFAVALMTLIVDLLYPFFDPRIRYK